MCWFVFTWYVHVCLQYFFFFSPSRSLGISISNCVHRKPLLDFFLFIYFCLWVIMCIALLPYHSFIELAAVFRLLEQVNSTTQRSIYFYGRYSHSTEHFIAYDLTNATLKTTFLSFCLFFLSLFLFFQFAYLSRVVMPLDHCSHF